MNKALCTHTKLATHIKHRIIQLYAYGAGGAVQNCRFPPHKSSLYRYCINIRQGIYDALQDSRFKIQDSRFKIQDSRFKIQDSRHRYCINIRRLWCTLTTPWFVCRIYTQLLSKQRSRFKIQDSRFNTQLLSKQRSNKYVSNLSESKDLEISKILT